MLTPLQLLTGEGDYITAFMPTKQKKIRVTCCVWKIAVGNTLQAKCMRARNRMKTVFSVEEQVITIQQSDIIRQLPKPNALGSNKFIFDYPLEID